MLFISLKLLHIIIHLQMEFFLLHSMNMVRNQLLSRSTLSSAIIGVVPRELHSSDEVRQKMYVYMYVYS